MINGSVPICTNSPYIYMISIVCTILGDNNVLIAYFNTEEPRKRPVQ